MKKQRNILPYLIKVERKNNLKILADRLCNEIAPIFGQCHLSIKQKIRKQEIKEPRHIVMYLLYIKGFGWSEIGEYFNNDHSTVISAVKKIESNINIYKEYQWIKEY